MYISLMTAVAIAMISLPFGVVDLGKKEYKYVSRRVYATAPVVLLGLILLSHEIAPVLNLQ